MKKVLKRLAGIILLLLGLFTLMFPEWLVIPLLLVGYLEGPNANSPFPEAHARAVKTFVDSQGFGYGRFRRSGYWMEHSVRLEGNLFRPTNVNLIGLTPEEGDRYFEGRMPKKAELTTAKTRKLSEDEAAAVAQIRAGTAPWVRLPAAWETFVGPPREYSYDTVHIIAPITADKSCLECHKVKQGSLLGAFDYEMMPLGKAADEN
ncbi:hypothetical protein GCM10023213_38740 [Prosthecobacter algae]|uniref:Cytochrome P460 n=1 Tax=Prosthecobacter algae TaxID=1144682 RepID=A0ABP9PGA7_9BACT